MKLTFTIHPEHPYCEWQNSTLKTYTVPKPSGIAHLVTTVRLHRAPSPLVEHENHCMRQFPTHMNLIPHSAERCLCLQLENRQSVLIQEHIGCHHAVYLWAHMRPLIHVVAEVGLLAWIGHLFGPPVLDRAFDRRIEELHG